jgi:Haloacid dehalogenase-like hydrolase
LTNNLPEVQTRQLQRSGMANFFEHGFSAHSVRRHKPSPQVYAHIVSALRVRRANCTTQPRAILSAARFKIALEPDNCPAGSRLRVVCNVTAAQRAQSAGNASVGQPTK